MAQTRIVTLDLNFQGNAQAIAAYLIRGGDAVVLIESGPGSTLPGLEAGLAGQGLALSDVTHVLLTHIHLDHAGASGRLSRSGAEIYVHRNGAPHLLNPEKLIASAGRIYGDRMESLWGEILPVEEHRLHIPSDGEEIRLGNLKFTAVDTPGHAEHHFCYLFEDVCFSGDVGGVRMPGYAYLRVPMPPPELHFEKWRASIARLQELKFDRIAPTHFGIHNDPRRHLEQVDRNLTATLRWLEGRMRADPSAADLAVAFEAWMAEEAAAQGLSATACRSFELANPLGMSADGMLRYWRKVRLADNSTNVTRNG